MAGEKRFSIQKRPINCYIVVSEYEINKYKGRGDVMSFYIQRRQINSCILVS